MKKTLLSIVLALAALAANAQLGLGGQIGFRTTGGSSHYSRVAPTATASYDYTVGGDVNMLSTTTVTVLPQVSYNITDKFDVGADFGATWSKTTDRSGYTTLRQRVDGFEGWQSTAGWSFLFAPYLRYKMAVNDRWTMFCEAQLTFSLTPNATRHVYESAYTLYGVDHPEVDMDDPSFSYHESSISITVVPGVSYKINKWLEADLYIDLLGLGFIHSRSTTFNDYAVGSSTENTGEVTSIENQLYLTADATTHGLADHLNLFRLGFSINL